MAPNKKSFKRYCNYFTSYNRETKVKAQDKRIKVIFENEIEGKKGKFTTLSIQFEDGTEISGNLRVKQKPVKEE